MLPLLRDQLRIVLCPDRVVLLRLERGLRTRLRAKQVMSCAPSSDETAWQAPLMALKAALTLPEWQDAEAQVILSNHFVRYAIIPWSDALNAPDEEQAFVHYHFSKVYGNRVAQWSLRVSNAGYGAPRLASAVDQSLLEGIESALSGMRLKSIQPYLMSAFNQWRRRLKGDAVWFLLFERNRLCMALIQEGKWQAVRSQAMPASPGEALQDMLEQVAMLHGLPKLGGPVFYHAPDFPDIHFPQSGPWSLQRLQLPNVPGFSPFADAPFAMAMSGGL